MASAGVVTPVTWAVSLLHAWILTSTCFDLFNHYCRLLGWAMLALM